MVDETVQSNIELVVLVKLAEWLILERNNGVCEHKGSVVAIYFL